ncbi:hypothetical protein HCU01_36420 [Halomonas cupida]|uniref:General secretion pathway protein J n=1 Tax=Halomonas cupida TaxID=44933 RepID=A0A1M7M7L5_9GAMM|nr:prepilin-type N-terminal cleavage/methylation domain-containing protein [Halomonas cupida]GEN25693.1 hypothetical protein HCU01_36420 [Halomonas cupida]SHM86654.1 general secretion pathway protein J [Halomonas cupida]
MKLPANQRRQQRGFTLLEVVIAIGLSAILAMLVAAQINALVGIRERLDIPSPGNDELHLVRLLERRLDALVIRPLHEQGQPLLNQPLELDADGHRLQWVAISDWPVALGDHYSRVRRQRLVHDPEEERLTLYSAGLLDALESPDWQLVTQLEGVSEVEMTFHDGTQWRSAPFYPQTRALRLSWRENDQQRSATFMLPEASP